MNQRITLPIEPKAQARAKFSRAGYAYKSSAQKDSELWIGGLLEEHRPERPITGPVKVRITAYMRIPKATSKKRRALMIDGEILHTKKPDVDNLAKNILDCMSNLFFWDDDRQVYSLAIDKYYSEQPRWEIYLEWKE